ncbi:MAG TPA: DUF6629 family protein [Acidimicrobiia bacterium]
MCFSAEADLIGGILVGGAGVDALRHVGHRRELVLAALPLVFGAHQMIEAFTWWGLDGRVPEGIGNAATWVYLTIAFLLPLVVPLAVLSVEPDPGRRRMVTPFAILGVAVSATLLFELFTGPVSAAVAGLYIAYDVDLSFGGQMTVLYVAATCGPLLLSSRRRIMVFGVLNLAAVTVLARLMASGVISLWCAWAAVCSVAIVIHLRTADRPSEPVSTGVPG